MYLCKTIFFLLLVFLSQSGTGQVYCSSIGQTPASAIIICKDNAVINQSVVAACATNPIWIPFCSTKDKYYDYTPVWYKFTCSGAGNFGFEIKPNNAGDDYNWALFDVTGHPLIDIFTRFPNSTLVISSNWSGSPGATGASPSGMGVNQCYSVPSDNATTFNIMPQLLLDHTYYLMVGHPLNTPQSGYQLTLQNGTASIADPTYPNLGSAVSFCGGQSIVVKLTKKVTCESLSGDGSEFEINPPLASVIGASAFSCFTALDADSITLRLNQSVPAGTYNIVVKKGSDGNTLSDFCDQFINEGVTVPVVIAPFFPIKMDSITAPECAADEIQLVFSKNIRCGSIAANGSDFIITGNTPVTITRALGVCDYTNLASVIRIKLSAPLVTKGNYTIQLVKGTDNNTLLDECGLSVLVGTTLTFSSKDTVNADFSYKVNLGCKFDTINYFHEGANEVNKWIWNFDNQHSSMLQNPQVLYDTFGMKRIQLTVSNGVCSASSAWVPVLLGNELKAVFEATNLICPGDVVHFKDYSIGNIIAWNWSFGNGTGSILHSPPAQSYPIPNAITDVNVQLVVKNDIGCQSTATQKITLFNECYVWVPTAFTPNNDGINDYLYPLNADKFTGLVFRVYNRYGKLVFETNKSDNRWDGRIGGQDADSGTYIWILQYNNTYSGRRVEKRGTSVLLR